MTTPVLTFFNCKGNVWKTFLVYHVASMLSKMDRPVLAVDLDPQANLTAAFLTEEELAAPPCRGPGALRFRGTALHRVARLPREQEPPPTPLGQEARRPIFDLTVADGAIGSQAVAATDAYNDFRAITLEVLRRTGAG